MTRPLVNITTTREVYIMTETKQDPTFWAAPELATADYPVFPLGGKAPAVEGGFYAATTDHSEIAAWIEAGFGDCDIGMATGQVSGVVVIEADSPTRRDEMEHQVGPPHVITRRGAHWYFKHPRDGKVVSRSVATNLDCKGDGGYVAVPPSTNKTWNAASGLADLPCIGKSTKSTSGIPDKNELPELPAKLREELRPGRSANGSHPEGGYDVGDLLQMEVSAIIARHVKVLPSGKRHAHLKHLCGVLLRRGVAHESAERMLIKAWQLAEGDLAARAPKEVPNTLRTTAAAIAEGNATGVPNLEELSPGLAAELEAALSKEDPVLVEDQTSSSGPADLLYIEKSTKSATKLELVRFARRPSPPPQQFIIPDLVPRHHPTTLYGWSGTAKSTIALYLAMCIAGGREEFFGYEVMVHGPVIYLDFELDADGQQNRAERLAAGMGIAVPDDLMYIAARGVRTNEAIGFALAACAEHEVVLGILDSLGPAMVGDMSAAKDVIGFHNNYIAPFKAVGATPLLVDHQARQQAGEGYQSKGAFGSAYKEHLSRSLIQVEAGDRSTEENTLNIRLRHKKTNFGVLCEPFDVTLQFSEKAITATVRDLTPADRAQETTLNSKDRVIAALEDGPAYPDELVESTGLARSTVKNTVNALKRAGVVEITGEVRGQMEQVQLVAPVALPIKGGAASAAEDLTPGQRIIALLRDPPGWLSDQLKLCREESERYFEPTCAAISRAVFEDSHHAEEVAPVLQAHLEQEPLY
jgi:DNA-binding transcriptional ArsR family regulator